MTDYPYESIWLNGREVAINSIVKEGVNATSEFERSTFEFISQWFNGAETFAQNTSGSTGIPKLIRITRGQMIASASMTIDFFQLKKGLDSLLCLSPVYIAGKMMLVRSFIGGMKINAVNPSANPFIHLPFERTIDFAAMVPSQVFETIRSDNHQRLNAIKFVIIGGAALDMETQRRLQPYRCTFFSTYGMTETVSHIALRQLNGEGASENYRVLPGVDVSVDERGCLVIDWKPLGRTITTNDIVEITEKNSFHWIGRWDNVINSGGIKIIPEKIEPLIESIFKEQQISNSFFIGSRQDQKLGEKAVLFVEGDLGIRTIEKLKARISEVIPKIEAPKEVCSVKSFVLTENGKINRKASSNLT